jgi:hypothetical protein
MVKIEQGEKPILAVNARQKKGDPRWYAVAETRDGKHFVRGPFETKTEAEKQCETLMTELQPVLERMGLAAYQLKDLD